MSRGPGRIERAICQLFTKQPDQAFTTGDLISHCYPATCPERKHRVAVQRAAHNVMLFEHPHWEGARTGMIYGDGSGLLIFYNRASVRSTALLDLISFEVDRCAGRGRVGYWTGWGRELEGRLTSPGVARRMQPEGEYHQQVQNYLADQPASPPPLQSREQLRAEMRKPDPERDRILTELVERIAEAGLSRPVNIVLQRTTLSDFANHVRALLTVNDPDALRQGLAEVVEVLDRLVGPGLPAESR